MLFAPLLPNLDFPPNLFSGQRRDDENVSVYILRIFSHLRHRARVDPASKFRGGNFSHGRSQRGQMDMPSKFLEHVGLDILC